MKQITENEFEKQFTILPNHINKRFGGMFETYGSENDYVKKLSRKENRVWTIIETDGKFSFITGYHRVNRLGHFITEEPYNEETEVISEKL
jgi:hypothetical protein